MKDYIPIIAILVAIGIAYWHIVSAKNRDRRRDSDNLRRIFHIYITNLHEKFSTKITKDYDLISLHKQSKDGFRSQCNSIRSEIYEMHIAMFDIARDAYLAITPADIECIDNTATPQPNKDESGNYMQRFPNPTRHYDTGRKNIRNHLETLIECSK